MNLIQKHCASLRELFYELAAMDKFNYPRLGLKWFSEYCLNEGSGLLKAEIREEKPLSEEISKKPNSKSKSRERKRLKIS